MPGNRGIDLKMCKEWILLKQDREKAFQKRHILDMERWSEKTKMLPPLSIGSDVMIQNQTGPRAKRWDLSGKVVENLGHESYMIKIDGSGQLSKRRRQFLRLIHPFPRESNCQTQDQVEALLSPNQNLMAWRSVRIQKQQQSLVASISHEKDQRSHGVSTQWTGGGSGSGSSKSELVDARTLTLSI